MAENNLYQITLLQDLSPWSEGDVVDVIWDDVAEDIIVERNASTEVSGPDLGFNNIHFTLVNYNYTFCTGNNLTWFFLPPVNPSFPYAIEGVAIDSSVCNSTPITCDLKIVKTYNVVAEDLGSDNGSFDVYATSSNSPIEYGLQDFDYGDGQSSISFTGLSTGVYTVYARDSQNCSASKQVTIPLNDSYSALYRTEWKDLQGNTHRFDLEERDYSGAVTEKDTAGVPFSYSKPSKGINNFYKQPIEPSNATINIMSDTDYLYRSLFTQDERKYRGVWSLNTGGGLVEQWRGFLIPSAFSEPYIEPPYPTSLTFTDGLNDLKRIDYLDDNDQEINGEEKAIEIIARILNKLNLNLGIKVGINMYSGSMNTTATDDPLDQVYIDSQTFYRDGKALSCYDVLHNILIDFGARIFQWQSYWWITRIQEEGASYDYREFDAEGAYVTNSSYSPVVNIDEATVTSRLVFQDRNQVYTIYPSYGKITINNDLNEVNLLENGEFKREYSNPNFPGFLFWSFIPDGGNTSLTVGQEGDNKYIAIYNVSSLNNGRDDYILSAVQNITIGPSDKLKFSYKFAVDKIASEIPYMSLDYKVVLTLSGTDYYLQENGEWSTGNYKARHNPSPSSDWSTFSIEADSPLTSGDAIAGTFKVYIYNYYLETPDFGNYLGSSGETELRALTTTTKPIGYRIDGKTVDASQIYHRFYTLEFGTEADNYPDIVRPNDYNATTNAVHWTLNNTFWRPGLFDVGYTGITVNDWFYIDDATLQVLPNGQKPISTETISLLINGNIKENLEVDLLLADVPQYSNGGRIVNDINTYNDYYRLSDGSPILDWARDGVSESQTIQKILIKQLADQFTSTTNKITGTATSYENGGGGIYVGPFNTLKETHDANKIYHIDGLTIFPKMNTCELELLELNSENNDDGGNAFSGDFNNDYGNSFDTITN